MSIASPVSATFQSHGAFARRPVLGTLLALARGAFSKLLDAMMLANQKRAEREIALFIERNGGRMTDNVERLIARNFLPN